jgi:hypothetical protein
MHRRPVRLGLPAVALPCAGTGTRAGEQPGLQLSVGDVVGQRPGQPRRLEPADRRPHRRRCRSHPPRNLAGRQPADFNLITSRTWRIANLSVGIQVPLRKSRKAGPYRSQKRPRHPGRHHPGMVGEIKSERWARSFRNGGRDRAESAPRRRLEHPRCLRLLLARSDGLLSFGHCRQLFSLSHVPPVPPVPSVPPPQNETLISVLSLGSHL